MRIKSRLRTSAKFALVLSGIYEVVNVRAVLVSVFEIGTNRVNLVHQDPITNPLLHSFARVLEQVPGKFGASLA